MPRATANVATGSRLSAYPPRQIPFRARVLQTRGVAIAFSVALVQVLSFETSTRGQTPTVSSTAYVQFAGTVIKYPTNSGTRPAVVDTASFLDTKQSLDVAMTSGLDDATVGLAALNAGGFASATSGVLRASIAGELKTTSADSHADYTVSTGNFDGRARASWLDSATVDGLTFGQSIRMNANLILGGYLSATAGSSAGNTANVSALVSLSGTGITSVSGIARETRAPSFTHLHTDPPSTIPVSILMVVGTPYTITYTLEVRGVADAASNLSTPPGFADVDFKSIYSQTLTWNGITSITDATSGAPLVGWHVTSLSGFDYTQPAPIPEPASYLMISFALPTLLNCRCLSRRRSAIS